MQNHSNNPNMDSWEQDSYETGSTRPPKASRSLTAILLVLLIALGGICSVLGIVNIRLSLKLSGQGDNQNVIFSCDSTTAPTESDPAETTAPESVPPVTGDSAINLVTPPETVDNVPQEGGLSLQEIYEKAIDSVVSISCTLKGGTATGTGIVLTSDGYIVTNAHVVEDALSIMVLFSDDQMLAAQLVGADTVSDIAVLKVTETDLSAAEFADSQSLRVGDAVVAIGDPLGIEYRGTMTDGIISALNRNVTVENRTMTLIQTNAALNSGNSGGPLLNCYGQVIGINTMKIGSGTEGLGFAIPSSTVKEIVDQLIGQGYVSGRPSLGVTVEDLPFYYQQFWGLPSCVYITAVEDGSAASDVGLETGDIILSIDGEQVSDPDTLQSILYGYSAGDTVELRVYRDRVTYRVTVTLKEAKN